LLDPFAPNDQLEVKIFIPAKNTLAY